MALSDPDIHSQNSPAKIIAVIPAYNEDRFIGSVVIKARKYADVVLVVDDGSTDLTAEVARAAGALVVCHAENRGKGEALNTGFRKARELDEDAVVVVIDGDGQHDPAEIPVVVEPVLERQADMVVGSRFLGVQSNMSRWRTLGQHVLTLVTNIGSRARLSDSQSGFRAFSSRAVELLVFGQTGFSVESEMQFLARQHGLKVLEVPVSCRYEERPKRNLLSHGSQVLNGVLRLVGQHRPLLFFGLFGVVLLIAGLALGRHVVEIFYAGGVLPVGYALITVLLVVVGVLALFTGIILHSIRILLLDLKSSLRSRGNQWGGLD